MASTNYQESQSGTLPEWNTQVMGLLNQGKTQAGQAYQPYTNQQIAGFSPLQQQAFAAGNANVGNYQPYVNQSQALLAASPTAASEAAGLAPQFLSGTAQGNYQAMLGAGQPLYNQAASLYGQGAQYDPNQLQQHLNPYMSGVVNEIGRLGANQFQNQVAPALTGGFASMGQYGSGRQGAMLANAAALNQREVLGQQANALNTGWNNASQDYLNWSKQAQNSAAGLGNLGQQQAAQTTAAAQMQENAWDNAIKNALTGSSLQAQSSLNAGTALGNLGQVAQQLGIGDVNQLAGLGQLQQQNQQAQLDAAYKNFQEARQYPWEQLNNYAKLFGVGTPQASTSWTAGFKKGGLAQFSGYEE